MKMLTVLFAFVSVACQAQTTSSAPTMKGHTLGESVQQFVAESNDETRGQIKICSSTEKTVQASAPYECEAFNRTVKTGTGNFHCDLPMYELGICRNFRGDVTFANNKLVVLNLEVIDRGWDETLADVVSKFGKPDETHMDTMQNTYGAKFDVRSATWTKPNYLLSAFEKINVPYNLNRFVEITLTDHAYAEDQKAKRPHGNALD